MVSEVQAGFIEHKSMAKALDDQIRIEDAAGG